MALSAGCHNRLGWILFVSIGSAESKLISDGIRSLNYWAGMAMTFIDKITEYKDNIEALQAIDSMEVYRWMISLGQKLIDDPLSVNGRLPKNQVIMS